MRYLWLIAAVAALGGLLFGYDWSSSEALARSTNHSSTCKAKPPSAGPTVARLGCFVGSLVAGRISDRLERKRALLVSAILFALSSVLTGWSYQFSTFIFWRILGGVAIGHASKVSPMYIAEVSPAAIRVGSSASINSHWS